MQALLAIVKPLADESRLRTLWMLRNGEMCVCHIVDALRLSPATVSSHMSLLHAAGLVQHRKDGKWAYCRLADRRAPREVQAALRCIRACLGDDAEAATAQETACGVRDKDLGELCPCSRK